MNDIKWINGKRKVSELIEWEKNPRQITDLQFQELKTSIEKFNFTNPVIINSDNKIIAGHMRIKALKDLGRENDLIDIRMPDRQLTEEEYEELALRDNKNTGAWDFQILENYFESDRLLEVGFDEEELNINNVAFLDALESDGMRNSIMNESDHFAVTFLFEKKHEDRFKEYGKEYIQKQIEEILDA